MGHAGKSQSDITQLGDQCGFVSSGHHLHGGRQLLQRFGFAGFQRELEWDLMVDPVHTRALRCGRRASDLDLVPVSN